MSSGVVLCFVFEKITDFSTLHLKLQLTILFTTVRLVGGGNASSQGRVEVFRRGTWGRVCYHHWDLRDAIMVCRQLGFKGALSATSSAGFGKRKGNILMDYVHCAGNESSLTECEHSAEPLVFLVSHNKDASVVCRTGN